MVQRDQQIADHYSSDTSITLRDVEKRFGVKSRQIRNILTALGIPIRPEPRVTKDDMRPISPQMILIGQKIERFMSRQSLSNTQTAIKLGLTEKNLMLARQGLYDWKISELLRLADDLGVTIDTLVVQQEKA